MKRQGSKLFDKMPMRNLSKKSLQNHWKGKIPEFLLLRRVRKKHLGSSHKVKVLQLLIGILATYSNRVISFLSTITTDLAVVVGDGDWLVVAGNCSSLEKRRSLRKTDQNSSTAKHHSDPSPTFHRPKEKPEAAGVRGHESSFGTWTGN